MWNGDKYFVLKQLISKDFKVRYRNMSLGAFWSLLNPLVMMTVMTFVFTKVFTSPEPHFPVFLLCGLVPYNFFALAWSSGTGSIIESTGLIKRVPVPREIVPVASVLSNCVHLLIQIALLIAFVLGSGIQVNIHWLWLPLLWFLTIIFVTGLAMITSALSVYIRDTRYVVESINLILFWIVPIFYSFSIVPDKYRDIYQYNPVAAIVMALRNVFLDGHAPPDTLLIKFTAVSIASLAIGWFTFRRMQARFFDYL